MEMDTNMRQLYKEDAENKKEFSLEFKVTTAKLCILALTLCTLISHCKSIWQICRL